MSEVHDMIPSFNFYLLVDGVHEIPLKSVQPFTRDNEYDTIQEGGMNDYVYLKRKPISQPFKLVVERYCEYGLGLFDPLTNGAELLLPLILFVGKNAGGGFESGRYYTFTGAVVMGITYGGLDAEKGGLLTETITYGYNHMFCLTMPSSESDSAPAWSIVTNGLERKYSKRGFEPRQNEEHWDDIDYGPTGDDTVRSKARRWNFDGTKVKGQGKISHRVLDRSKEESKPEQRKYNFAAENNKEYKGDTKSVRSAQNANFSDKTLGPSLGIKELSLEQMTDRARKFELDKDGVYTGNGKISARSNPNIQETRKKEMIDGARQWEFDGTSKAGKGGQYAQNGLVTEYHELDGGGSIGLGKPEESKETMTERAVRGVKNTYAGVVGTDPVPRKWVFDKEGTKDGAGDRSRQNAVINEGGDASGMGVAELSKETMAESARKWAFTDENSKGGGGVSSRVPPKVPEISKSDMTDLAVRGAKNTYAGEVGVDPAPRKWEFDKTQPPTKAGQGISSRADSGVEELSKSAMTQKAVKHVKRTIEDFLMGE